MDEELKDQGIAIDGKEAKRQFLEELRNKNEEEDRKIEEAQNNEVNEDDNEKEEKRKFLEEIRKNAEDKKTENNDSSIESKEIVNSNEEINNEATSDKEEKDDSSDSENLEDKESEEDKVEENTDLVPINDEGSEKKAKKFLNGVLVATLIDTAVTALSSLIALYLFDLLLRIPGYQVIDFKGIYIIIFLIISVLYPIIMNCSKQGKTLGQKYGKMEVKEREE